MTAAMAKMTREIITSSRVKARRRRAGSGSTGDICGMEDPGARPGIDRDAVDRIALADLDPERDAGAVRIECDGGHGLGFDQGAAEQDGGRSRLHVEEIDRQVAVVAV